MKNYNFILLTLVLTLFFNACKTINQKASGSDFPALENRYFGQKLPGLIPEVFAPEMLSPKESFQGGMFSQDMKEFYFVRKKDGYKERSFFVVRYENNSWGKEANTDIKWPRFSEDGNTMYVGKEQRKRTDTGWSEPKSLGEFLKNQAHGLSVSSKETYYYAVYKKEDNNINGKLYYCPLEKGKYENPVRMNADMNKGEYIAHPLIAPDESYLIWDVRREGGYGQADLYISFKQNDKEHPWSSPINMGPTINSGMQESSPMVTQDGKYLFFNRGEWIQKEDGKTYYVGKNHWVDAKVIENLRPKQ